MSKKGAFSFKEILDRYVPADGDRRERLLWALEQEEKSASHGKSTGWFYPSALSSGNDFCFRQAFFLAKYGRPHQKIEPSLARIFEVGKDAHDRIQWILQKKLGEGLSLEVSFRDEELKLSGRCDGVYSQNGTKFGLEIKTANAYFFSGLPLSKNMDQAAIYLFEMELDAVYLLYENKNTQQLKEFAFTAEDLEDRWQELRDRLKYLVKCLEEDILPEGIFLESVCKKCLFSDRCSLAKTIEGSKERSARDADLAEEPAVPADDEQPVLYEQEGQESAVPGSEEVQGGVPTPDSVTTK